jgi:oxazoline/thiazoline dehydrogenase
VVLEELSERRSIAALEENARECGFDVLISLQLLLQLLAKEQLLEVCTDADAPLASFEAVSSDFDLFIPLLRRSQRYRLSRFALVRRSDDNRLVVESPLGLGRVILHRSEALNVVFALSKTACVDDIDTAKCEGSQVESFLLLLILGKSVQPVDERDVGAEESSVALRQWEFHDLLLHTRSRLGRSVGRIGGTFRFKGDIPPRPALREPNGQEPPISLCRPNSVDHVGRDPPLYAVMESRTSIRDHESRILTITDVGELLYRAARVRGIKQTDGGELSNRPYPSGGASYELELYLSVDRCVGLHRGFYYYDPLNHALRLVCVPNQDMEMLLYEAWLASAQQCRPQILITFASRFQRVSWKYSGMAYATQLKNVGALYSMMYLVATAMNLAPCGLGLGNSDRFCRLAGTSYYEEGSVGEFALGGRSAGR